MALAGTVTVSVFVFAEVTIAFTAPKYTILAEGVVLKLLPFIITELPVWPLAGLKELIIGWLNEYWIINIQPSKKV